MATGYGSTLIQVPRALLTNKYVKRRAKILLGIAVFFAVLFFILTAVSVGNASKARLAAQNAQAAIHSIVTPKNNYVAMAQQVAVDYLNAQPTAMPVAKTIPNSLGRTIPNANGNPLPARPIRYTSIALYNFKYVSSSSLIDNFLVDTPTQTYILSIPLEVTSAGPVVSNYPALASAVIAQPQVPAQQWQAQQSISLPQNAQAQVDAWAKAYVTNNRYALYWNVVRDTQQRQYFGLSGNWVMQGTPTIVSAVIPPDKPYSNSNYALVQVKVTMAPRHDSRGVFTAAYDLLLSNMNTTIPDVVAWGPAGSGGQLHPYQNAEPGQAPSGQVPNTSGASGVSG